MSVEALRVANLEKFFPPALAGWKALINPIARLTVPALRGVSFDVEPGEVVALVGENGAGKSTLLRILTTLLLPTRGNVWVGGADVVRDAARVRQQIGYHSGSDGSFYARLSVRENLLLFASLNNLEGAEAAKRIAALGEMLSLEEVMNRQLRTLSTGNVHRVGLARALLHRPAMVILDEPTRSLDPLAAAEFRHFLLRDVVHQHGTTLLFASHSLAEVEEVCNRMVVLHSGKLLAFDTPAKVKSATGSATLEQSIETLVRRADSAS